MRKLMWFTVGFAAGCAFCSYFIVSWMLPAFLLGLLLCLVFAFASRFHIQFAVIALITFGASIGFGWFWCQDTAYLSNARRLDGATTDATVTAADFGYDTDYGTAVDGEISVAGKSYKVRLYMNEKQCLAPGDKITGVFFFRYTALGGRKDPTSHPGEGMYLLLYQRGEVQVQETSTASIQYYPAIWRQILLSKLEEIFPADTAGFAKALLLGDRSGIDYETNTAFKLSGISHIIAVSGLHVSMLFGLLYTLSFRRRWLTGLIAIPALVLFAAIVGFTPSITRACIMQSLMILAMLTEREYDPPTALAFAVLVMLGVNPMTVTSVSFQLSVGCMIGIFLFTEKIRAFLESPKGLGSTKGNGFVPRCKRWFASSVSVSIGASVVTTPLVAIYFGAVSLVGVLTNLLTLWVVTFVFGSIILALCLAFLFPSMAVVLAAFTSFPIRYVLLVSKLLANFPLSAVYTQSIYIVIWLVGCYVLLTAYLLCRTKYPLAFSCCAAISLCFALLLSWSEPLSDDLRVTVLDVGQGQCILLQSEGKTYMVDCGGDSDTQAADTAAEYLLSQGIDTLNGIILTHYDADHAAGVEYLLSRVDTDALLLPDILDESGIGKKLADLAKDRTSYIVKDTVLSFGKTTITIFASEATSFGNDSGLCVLFQNQNCDILITGDRGISGEAFLLNRTELPQLELLIAGHHGSASSTGEALLTKTAPETVIISVGANNHYGHPAPSLLTRLAEFGCIVYRTDVNGTVIYRG